jgi:putative addiction module component (TIGR02574 family)
VKYGIRTALCIELPPEAMTMLAKEVREELFKLPVKQRRKLAPQLWDSADEEDSELSPELKAELDRRLALAERDPSRGRPWEEVYERLVRRTFARHARYRELQ